MILLYKILLAIYAKADKNKRKVIKLFLEAFRRLLSSLGDPSYVTTIRGKEILLPASHRLPIYIIDCPLYDTLPARIADFVRARGEELVMVDVGANVGDTILACGKSLISDHFLGVEANPKFVPYLRKNTGKLENFALVEAFCSSGNTDQTHVRIEAAGGTARVIETENGLAIPQKTVDQIVIEHPKFKNLNFLKLDTDGNDFDILEGSQESIITNRPIILLECDIFGNVHYVEKVLKSLQLLAKAGYSSVIAYDNLGNYFCNFAIEENSQFLDALAYQIISQFGYYDLLFLAEKDKEFISTEKKFFLDYVARRGMSPALRSALKF